MASLESNLAISVKILNLGTYPCTQLLGIYAANILSKGLNVLCSHKIPILNPNCQDDDI